MAVIPHSDDTIYDTFMKEYHNLHRACPKCGSLVHSSTLVGYAFNYDHPEEYKDMNAATCLECRDVHRVHDRVPANLKFENII